MIKASELRIGNLVDVLYGPDSRDPGWRTETVVRIYEDQIYFKAPVEFHILYFSSDLGDAEKCTRAIPLTEEWLLKLGVKFSHHTDDGDSEFGVSHFFEILHESTGEFWWLTNDAFRGVELKYVHQVQNLYFALNGKELQLQNK